MVFSSNWASLQTDKSLTTMFDQIVKEVGILKMQCHINWLRLQEKFQCFSLWGYIICKSDGSETKVMLLTSKCLMTKDNEHRHVYTP